MIKDINFTEKAVEKINQLVSKKKPGTFFVLQLKVEVVQVLNMILHLTKAQMKMMLNLIML